MTRIDGFKQLVTKVAQSKGKVNIQGTIAQLADGTPLGTQIGKVSKTGNRAFRLRDGERTIIAGVNKDNLLISINHITENLDYAFSNGRQGEKYFDKLTFALHPGSCVQGTPMMLTQGNRRILGNLYAPSCEESRYVRNIIPRTNRPFNPDLETLPDAYRIRMYKATKDTNSGKYTDFQMSDRNIITDGLNTSGEFKKLI